MQKSGQDLPNAMLQVRNERVGARQVEYFLAPGHLATGITERRNEVTRVMGEIILNRDLQTTAFGSNPTSHL